MGFPDEAVGREATCQCRRRRRHGFDSWVGKIPWGRKQSYICQLGRNHPLTANLWQVAFFYYFHLEWWSIHSSERYTMGSPLMVTMLCLMELLLLQSWREGTSDLQVNPFLWVVGTYPQGWLPVSMGKGGLTGLKVIASFILIKFNGLCNERLQLME